MGACAHAPFGRRVDAGRKPDAVFERDLLFELQHHPLGRRPPLHATRRAPAPFQNGKSPGLYIRGPGLLRVRYKETRLPTRTSALDALRANIRAGDFVPATA